MSAIGGPNIVEDGLVLALDAANVKSFKGEPTVNYITDIGDAISERTGGEFSQYFNLVPIFETHGLIPYTLSMEIKGNIPGACLVYMQNGSYTKYGFVSSWVTITTEWQRFVFPNITPAGPTAAWQANTPNDNRAMLATYTIYGTNRFPTIRNIQIEPKPYATPFVDGTRGTTVATGGGWADKSGNSNHGELINGLIFDNANAGSLVFDGANDYVSLSNSLDSLNGTTEASLFMWVKLNNNNNNVSSTGIIQLSGYNSSNGNLYFYANGYTYLDIFRTSRVEVVWSNSVIDPTNWHMLTITTKPGSNGWKAYLNSNLEFQTTGQNTVSINSSIQGGLNIGRNNVSRELAGKIAITQVYNRALTQQEVQQNYIATKSRFGF